jgi:hypothetical protein
MRKRLYQAVCENPADWMFAAFMLFCFVMAVNTLGSKDDKQNCVVEATPIME